MSPDDAIELCPVILDHADVLHLDVVYHPRIRSPGELEGQRDIFASRLLDHSLDPCVVVGRKLRVTNPNSEIRVILELVQIGCLEEARKQRNELLSLGRSQLGPMGPERALGHKRKVEVTLSQLNQLAPAQLWRNCMVVQD